MVRECHGRVGVWFFNKLSPTVLTLAIDDEWQDADVLAVCRRHYKFLRTRDGVSLGYRKTRDGKTVAYIKDESF